jgi:hypothetical protein
MSAIIGGKSMKYYQWLINENDGEIAITHLAFDVPR